MKNIQHFILLLMLGFSAAIWVIPSFAQEDVGSDTKATSQSKTQNIKPEPKPEQKVFKPSEEISEDLPVPFPVDI